MIKMLGCNQDTMKETLACMRNKTAIEISKNNMEYRVSIHSLLILNIFNLCSQCHSLVSHFLFNATVSVCKMYCYYTLYVLWQSRCFCCQKLQQSKGETGFGGMTPCAQTKGKNKFYEAFDTPDKIVREGRYRPVPILFGTNSYEGTYVYDREYYWYQGNYQLHLMT